MNLTLPQQDVYFEQLLYPTEPIYNIGAKVEIKGALNHSCIQKAYKKLIDQHDAYRGIIKKRENELVSFVIKESHDTVLGFVDFSDDPEAEKQANLYMQNEFVKPFDLFDQQLLHKFTLVKVSDTFHYFFSVYHHIITDGWGTSLMFQRLVQNYNEYVKFGEVSTEYPYTYKVFAEDDLTYQNSGDYKKDKDYWLERFKQLPENLFAAKDKSIDSNRSSRKELLIKRTVYNQLNSLSSQYKTSTFHILLGLLYVYFGRKHQQNDLIIGLPVLNRGKSIFKKTVGLFMGVSPLRIRLRWESTFLEVIQQVKQQLRQDYRHQRFPIGKLIQELDVFNEKNRLFNMTLSYEKQNYSTKFLDTSTRVIPLSHMAERVALALYIREFEDTEDVRIDFDYNLNYFNENEITALVSHFGFLLKAVIQNFECKINGLNYLPSDEKALLIHKFNATKHSFPKHRSVFHLFEEQVKKTPDTIAISDGSQEYTFSELYDLSNNVAHDINSRGPTQKPIGLLLDRSVDMVVVMLGILKSGRVFIALDPIFPKERILYILKSSETDLIITNQSETDYKNTDLSAEIISYSEIRKRFTYDIPETEIIAHSESTAYVIYTSGSTGTPKGVEVKHASFINFLLSMKQSPGIASSDVVYAVTTFSFDISLLEIFLPLISGARVHIASSETLSDPYAIIQELVAVKASFIQGTPSFYQMLINAGWKGNPKLKILCGGDLLATHLAKEILSISKEVWNMYGPTETTIWSSIKRILLPEDASNIGKPISNTRFYILDSFKNILPIGAIGTLYIAGNGLAKGYFNDKKRTDQKFIPDPFYSHVKMYNTGDLAKWNTLGEIEFIGRDDNQVKIRGYRVELGEIEAKINEIEGISSSVVVTTQTDENEITLVAYVRAMKPKMETSYILSTLQKSLPNYMIPYTIVFLDKFPLTANKKIDRKNLSNRKIGKSFSKSLKVASTPLEIKLSKFFDEVLKLKGQISITDSFFRLGGHSLMAVRLIGLIQKELNFNTSLKDIFDFPTVELLARHLEGKKAEKMDQIEVVPEQAFYPLTFPQYAIWLASLQRERSIAYNMFAGYNINGVIHIKNLERAFHVVIDKYEILRTSFVEYQGQPLQKINAFGDVEFSIDEFSFESRNEFKNALELYANQEIDITSKTLLRIGIFQNYEGQKVILVVTHHIMMDGWSIEVMIKDVLLAYNAMLNNEEVDLGVLPVQFKDYASWENNRISKNVEIEEQFWMDYLNGYTHKYLIPYDRANSNKKNKGAFYSFQWEATFHEQLNMVAIEHNVTLHTLLITAFTIMIFKTQGHDDVLVGTINSGRGSLEALYNQIGMFVKTVPLRSKLYEEQTLYELLHQSQQTLLMVDTHQDVPQNVFSKIDLEAIFVLQNPTFNYEKICINKALSLDITNIDTRFNRLPMMINVSINDAILSGSVYYDSDKYSNDTIDLTIERLKKVLEQIIEKPKCIIGDIDSELVFEQQEAIEINFNF